MTESQIKEILALWEQIVNEEEKSTEYAFNYIADVMDINYEDVVEILINESFKIESEKWTK